MVHFSSTEYGNEGSRTHEFGAKAKQAVQKARDKVAAVVGAKRDEVIFTSGATESNNLAILGLGEAGIKTGKKHIITTAIEHKAVLEPCGKMEREGFKVTRLPVDRNGYVAPDAVRKALQPETILVSVMQANNETGVRQPINEIAEVLQNHPAFFHTDAAQGFGKDLGPLQNKRIDLISISGHKIFAPKGIGALIARRRGYERPPLKPLVYGGGQERGVRPGTLPVALIAALGKAAEISMRDQEKRRKICREIRKKAIDAFSLIGARFTGDQEFVQDHVLNLSIPDLDSEAFIVALKDIIAISNGSACTSTSYEPSYVLKAMGMSDDEANSCVRLSWCHLTPEVDWDLVKERINNLQ
jgi:cysteine desulfurase